MVDTAPHPPSKFTYPRSLQRDVARAIADTLDTVPTSWVPGVVAAARNIGDVMAEHAEHEFDLDDWSFRCRLYRHLDLEGDLPCPTHPSSSSAT